MVYYARFQTKKMGWRARIYSTRHPAHHQAPGLLVSPPGTTSLVAGAPGLTIARRSVVLELRSFEVRFRDTAPIGAHVSNELDDCVASTPKDEKTDAHCEDGKPLHGGLLSIRGAIP